MASKRARRLVALEEAKVESSRRYPGGGKHISLRIGFVAGAMWRREFHMPGYEPNEPVPDR